MLQALQKTGREAIKAMRPDERRVKTHSVAAKPRAPPHDGAASRAQALR